MTDSVAADAAAANEVRLVSGPQAGANQLLPQGDTVIGGASSAIVLRGLISERLLLRSGPSGVVATALDLRHPVCRAGVALLGPIALQPGDQLEVGEHLLAVGPVEDVPARAPEPAPTTLDLPDPPRPVESRHQAMLPLLAPVAVALLLAVLVSGWFLLLGVLAPLVAYGVAWQRQRMADAEHERQVRAYDKATTRFDTESERLIREETQHRRSALPDAVAIQRIAAGPGPRLWERGRHDDDALCLRIGTGSSAATAWRVTGSPTPVVLHDVPVALSLREAGVLGLVAPAPTARGLTRWLLGQLAVLHPPEDLSLWLIRSPSEPSAGEWDWLRRLPHAAGLPELAPQLIGDTAESIPLRVEELQALLAHRAALARDPRTPSTTRPPDLVVVLDGASPAALHSALPDLLRTGPSLGMFFLCLAEASSALPDECTASVIVQSDGRFSLRRTGISTVRDVRADLVHVAWADRIARALSPVLQRGSSGELPGSVRLGALLSPDGAGSHAVLGAGEDGPLVIDLATDGPHLLLTAETPEGARSLARVVMTSLAAVNDPEGLAFVLVGGEELPVPHVSSAIRELDGALAARTLASLSAELDRRERLLASVAAADIDAYATHGGLPRLVLVIDEIASLAAELPDLVNGLMALCKRSGPLGVHLVLTTAHPADLPPSVLAGVTARATLRLADPAQSELVIGSPVAAELLERLPGRGYVRCGEGPLRSFQLATVLPEDVERLVPGAGQAHRPVTASPWLEPLPERVFLHELDAAEPGPGLAPAAFGRADLPAEQSQPPAWWGLQQDGHLLVVGGPRSGRTTLLRTLLGSLSAAVSASDLHVYALDGASDALQPLAALPHCGAVVSGADRDRVGRLISRLTAEVARRRRQLTERGFPDLAAQRARTADPLPYLVLLVDGWHGPLEPLAELLRDGPDAGLRVLITGDVELLEDELAALVPDRLVLRLEDPADYQRAGLIPDSVPGRVTAGRAFRARAGATVPAVAAVQIALLGSNPSEAGQAAALAELAAALPPARGRKPFRVDVVPASVSLGAATAMAPSGPGAGLAVGGDELRWQTVNLRTCGPGFTIAGPPGSGRSTALAVLARSLLECGTEVCLVTPLASPLRELGELAGVLLSADRPSAAQLSRALDTAKGAAAVLVDDAEQIEDEELNELLEAELAAGLAQQRSVVVAGDTGLLAASLRGFAFDARRSRSGLLLSPAVADGDLLGVRLPASAAFSGPPGRGLLIRSGEMQLVQVPEL